MADPGERLRELRNARHLRMRDVHDESVRLARALRDSRFILPITRLHDFEVQGVIPNVYRFYSLAHVYDIDLRELLEWYGVPRR